MSLIEKKSLYNRSLGGGEEGVNVKDTNPNQEKLL